MAKKVYDKKIDKNTDWGGDASTDNLPVAGGRVQEFVKTTLNKKAGAFLFDEDKNSYLVFADAEDEAMYIQSGGMMAELILSQIKLADPGADFRASSLTPTNFAASKDYEVLITYTWSSFDKDNVSTGNGTVVLTVNNRRVFTGFVPQGENSIDISKYLIAGDNNIRLSITDSYDNSRTMVYLINLVSLDISSSYDPSTINSGDITFRYTPIGSVIKTAHFLVDGVELETKEIATSGGQITQILPAQAHGTHSLVVYLSANIEGSDVRSNELYYDIISIEEGRVETLIASTIDSTTMVEFETLDIPYVVYNPSSHNSSVQLKVDGETLQDVIVDRKLQTWSFRAMKSGSMVLEIISNGVTKTINLTVTNSEVNVKPEENDLRLYLTSQNRSNQQINKAEWKYGDIEAQLIGFDFATNGWVRDSEGSMALKVSNDARVIIPRKIFEGEFRTSGKTIEFEFMATEMSDPNASIISSIFGDIVEEEINGKLTIIDRRVGFDITAQTAYFGSEQTSINTNFKENERVRLAFVVDKVANDRLVQVYINGILSGIQQYPSSDNFSQGTPQDIYIGGKDCTVMIYNIREYDNNLTQYQLLNNYIGDMDNTDKKIEVFYRNQLYDAYGNISYERALQYIPCLIIEGKLPESKGDKRPVNIYYENLQDPSKSYICNDAEIDVQGTSSQYYPRKNWKIKHKKGGFNMVESGIHEAKYKLRDNSIPETTFTYKADFAESSGVHNTGLAVYYEWAWRELGFKVPVQDSNYENGVRTTIDGFPILIFHRETPDSYLEFVGKYNFNNDKTEATFGFKPGMVSWETKNNTSPRILFEKADFESLDNNGNPDWLNDYEDRYPDNGYDNPFRLKRLTEWIISCKDNPSKFAEEVDDYFDVNSLLFFYVMTEFTAGIDQRGKNMFLTWYGEEDEGTDKCYLLFYDNDTVLGINNEGALSFGYGVEYHDRYGVGAGAANVWNAESSALWDLVERGLAKGIEDLYIEMRSKNIISYESLRYYLDDTHSTKWSESIYNEDGMFKYVNPLLETGNGSYLYALQGSREEHRKWWLFNRVLYMDSKYTTATHLSDYATMRLYTPPEWKGVKPNADFTLTALGDGYARVKFGSYIIKKRIKGGTTEVIEAPKGMTFGDTETIVYGAKSLKSIGDLSDKYIGTLDTSKATNLTELLIGSTAEGYTNQNLILLTVGNNNLLTKLNIANCVNLTQAVNLKGCPAIREIEATGSRITGVELPDGGVLSYLSLPGVASLTLRKQLILDNEGLKLDSYANVTTLIIEDTPNIDPFELVNKMNNLLRVRLIGLDGSSDDVSIFSKVKDLKGVGVGDETLTTSYLEGKWNLGSILKKDLEAYSKLWSDLIITSDNIISVITMTMNSTVEFNGNLSLTPYRDVEASVVFGDTEVLAPLVANVTSVIEAPDMVFDNTTVEIVWANALNLIGDLSDKYLGSIDIADVNTLESLIIGSELSGYSNPYFTKLNLGSENGALKMINVANCPNLTGDLDLTSCVNIKNVEAIGSGLAKVTFPMEYSLTYLSLPVVTSLNLINQSELTEDNFKVEGYSEITNLVIENCPLIESVALFEKTTNVTNLKLVGFNGISEGTSIFRKAIKVDNSYLEGNWHFDIISQFEYNLFTNKWSKLTITADIITNSLDMVISKPTSAGSVPFNPNLNVTSNKTFEIDVKYGDTNVLKTITKNDATDIDAPTIEYNNTPVTVHGASLLKSLNQLHRNYLVSLDTSKISNLKELVIGNDTGDYINTNFTNLILGDSEILDTIDVTGCVSFKQTLDLTGQPNMKVIKAKNTLISKIDLHPNTKLTTLHLPESFKDIKLVNQPLLTNISVSNINSLFVEGDVGISVINLIDENLSSLDKIRWVDIDESENLDIWVALASSNAQGMNSDGDICSLGDAIHGEYFVEAIDDVSYELLTDMFPNLIVTYTTFTEIPRSFKDVEAGRVLYANGLIASPDEYRVAELEAINSLNSVFKDNEIITKFPELRHCTSVTDMESAFENCINLVELSATMPYKARTLRNTFNGCSSLVNAPKLSIITDNMENTFEGCTSLVEAPTIPLAVTSLYHTFKGCSSMVEPPLIPEGVNSMNYTFQGCSSLVRAPEMPSTIYGLNSTFYECSSLVEVPTLPKNITSLYNAFYGCTSLVNAPIILGLVSNMESAFEGCTSLVNAPELSEAAININSTFRYCSSLVEAPAIRAPLTGMHYTFDGCTSLVTPPIMTGRIAGIYSAFRDCRNLEDTPILPEGITDLGYLFYRCSSLEYTSAIPESVTGMYRTFDGCHNLNGEFVIKPINPPLYNDTFNSINVVAIYVPDESVDIYKNASGWIALADKIKPMSEGGFEASGKFEDVEVGRVLYEKGLIASPTKSSVEELGEITSLDSVFSGNTTLTKFPELKHCIAITSLTNTFSGCVNLMEAPAIPRSVTSMNGTFNRCTSLLEAPIIPRGITTMKDTFKGAYYLDGKYIIKAINPPVYEGVFEADGITSIYVPDESVSAYKEASGWSSFTNKIKGVSEIPWDGVFADSEVGRVLYDSGLIADANSSSKEELSTITSLDRVFSDNKKIVKFPELKYCTSITSLISTFSYSSIGEEPIIPEGVTNITGAFQSTRLVEAPIVPEGVTNMERTFKGSYYLNGKYIIKPINPPIYNNTFEEDRVVAIYVPAESVDIYKNASGWIALADKIKPIVIK